METVTRFLLQKKWYNKNDNTVSSAAYCTDDNVMRGEVSVFDIDNELNTKNDEKIYKIGDKVIYKNQRHVKARADLKVCDIEKIKTKNGNLKVYKGIVRKFLQAKHCNIRPFPKDDAYALHIAGLLANISELHVRQN